MTTTALTSRLEPQREDSMSTFDEQARGSIALLDRRSASIERTVPQVDPLMAVMDKLANNPNLDADKIERLMNVFIDGQRKLATMQDERTFAEAMADFKKNPPEIVKRKIAKMKGIAKGSGREYEMQYPYADLDEYASAAMPALAERGITWSFPFSEDARGIITVSCILRYGLYQHTPTTLSSPPETSGTKNDLQAKGSALSYLERYTFCGATGLTAGMPDDDGQKKVTPAQAETCMDSGVVSDYLALIEGSGDQDELQVNYFKSRDAAAAAKDVRATESFANAKNKRLAQLNRAQKAPHA